MRNKDGVEESLAHYLDALKLRNKELERKLNPRMWTEEESDNWHRNIPNVQAAFDALRGDYMWNYYYDDYETRDAEELRREDRLNRQRHNATLRCKGDPCECDCPDCNPPEEDDDNE